MIGILIHDTLLLSKKGGSDIMGGMMKNHVSGIYCIKSLLNGKIYIGQSKSCTIRWSNHKHELKKNKHKNPYLQEDYNIYGLNNFEYTILEQCDLEFRDKRESYWIEHFKNNIYNLQSGGIKKWKQSQETMDKMKHYKHSDETKQKISASGKGKKHCSPKNKISDEARKKMSDSRKGRKLSEEHKQKLRDFNLDKTLSAEHKHKLSESHKGQIAWNKGIKSVSEEDRKRGNCERAAKYRNKNKDMIKQKRKIKQNLLKRMVK